MQDAKEKPMGFSEDDMNDQQADDVDKYEREHRELDWEVDGTEETIPEYERRISKLLADARGLRIDWKTCEAFEDETDALGRQRSIVVAADDELFELIELVEEEMEEAYSEPYDRDDDVIGEYEMYGPDRPTWNETFGREG